eukprot:533697-Pyramimonas_sp.AAC.1
MQLSPRRRLPFRAPLVPNSAPAAALASFPCIRSSRVGLPLQRWPHARASARFDSCSRCSGGVISRAMPRRAVQC